MNIRIPPILGCAIATLAVSATALARNHEREHERDHHERKRSAILYSCNMDFRATGKSIYIGLGWSNIHGKGSISCYDLLHGTTLILPIKVKVKGPGAGLGVTGLVLSGAVAGIGVEKGPENLLGRYVAVRANAAVGVGAGAAVGLRVSKGAISVDVRVQAESGLGAGIDLLSLNIEPDGDSRAEAPLAIAPLRAPQAIEREKENFRDEREGDERTDRDDREQGKVESKVEVKEQAPAKQPEPVAAATTATAAAEVKTVTTEKSNIVFLREGQPLQILDGKGKVIQTIYLKSQK